ncbi:MULTISPECIES: ATP-binding protein [Streptomyces]|uniref:DNA replication protein n=2 Tax=Streptomyces TaxID=1883 RepID=A0A0W7X342_9ACTN|nr:ATP-binding protein [Streptomyces silvensis]KUF17321.1 DNA replication protein [Streptomyces silvensis]MVO84560.1 DNA replication protein [Streptomyces typhae]
MTRARYADPQPAIPDRLRERLETRLAQRGLDLKRPLPETPEPIPALQAAQARIPVDYRAALPEHPDVTAWVRAISANAAAPNVEGVNPHYGTAGRRQVTHGPSLLLWGATGTGKTHQAYGAIRALTAAGCGVAWHATTAADLYAALRPRPGVDPEVLLRRLMRIPVLLLDDFGAAKPSEWTEEITFRLVNWRCQNRLPTLFSSNMPPLRTDQVPARQAVLRDKVGDRVLSRLSGMCTAIEFTGPDRRYQRR